MSGDEKQRPHWTMGLTAESSLMVFCPHYEEKKKEREAAAANAAKLATVADTTGGDEPVSVTGGTDAAGSAPSMSPAMAAAALAGGCPVVRKGSRVEPKVDAPEPEPSSIVNPDNNMLIEEKQRPAPGQSSPLPTARRMSTIPKSEYNPGHQNPENGNWEYPSQQMFFNAMKRKGHNPTEEEMSTIVGMHNAVNEYTWSLVVDWERSLHPESADDVRLKKFSGDASNYTPKARFRNLLGHDLPFDRHDWIVERDHEEVHYVIDYYNAPGGGSPMGIYVDVRPALDSVGGLVDRVKMSLSKLMTKASGSVSKMQFPTMSNRESSTAPLSAKEAYNSRRWGSV